MNANKKESQHVKAILILCANIGQEFVVRVVVGCDDKKAVEVVQC